LASAKKSVTTYLPNESAPKMDGAQALYRDPAVRANLAKGGGKKGEFHHFPLSPSSYKLTL